MGSKDQMDKEEEGYRLLLPPRVHPFDKLFTSRCTLEVTPEQILAIESAGIFRRRWTHKWGTSTTFEIETSSGRGSADDTLMGIRSTTEGKKMLFAVGYPRAKIEEVVGQLERIQSEWHERMAPAAPFGAGLRASVLDGEGDDGDVAKETSKKAESDDQARKRSDRTTLGSNANTSKPNVTGHDSTDIQFEPTADGIRIDVPPSGVLKGTYGLWFPFAIFAFIIVAVQAALLVKQVTGSNDFLDGLPAIVIMDSVLCAIGLCLRNVASRQARLEVTKSSVKVTRKSMFSDRTFEFPRADVTDIQCGNSTLQVNNKFVEELQIRVNGNLEVRMLSQRSTEEIQLVCAAMLAYLSEPQEEDAA